MTFFFWQKKLKKLTLIKTYGAIPVMNLNGTLWDICMINGHTQKNLCHILIVDGPFIESLKNLNLVFRGSENQRLIKLPETLSSGRICLWEKEI